MRMIGRTTLKGEGIFQPEGRYPSQIFITIGEVIISSFHLLIIALLGVSPSVENGSVLFVTNLASWAIGTSFCRVTDA